MIKIKTYNIVLIFVATLSIFAFASIVDASSIGTYVPTTSLTVGNSSTITVSGNDAIGRVNISSSNSNIVSVSASSLWIEGSANFTITAKAVGNATITISPVDMANSSGETVSLQSKSITIYSKAVYVDNRSKNNNLSGLTIEGYELDFNKDNTSYTLDVDYDVSKLNISASSEDNKASVNIEQPEELQPGENIVKINVTAENQSVKTYEIKVNKSKNPEDVNAKLKSLKVVNTNIKNVFSPDTLEYLCEDITFDVDSLVLEYEPEIEGAKIEVLGNEKLEQGINHVIVKVTSKDESTTTEYDIIVFKSNQIAALAQVDEQPKNNVVEWIKSNKIVVLCLTVILILLIVIIILLVKNKKKSISKYMEDEEQEIKKHRRNPSVKNEEVVASDDLIEESSEEATENVEEQPEEKVEQDQQVEDIKLDINEDDSQNQKTEEVSFADEISEDKDTSDDEISLADEIELQENESKED